jgi:hypothetical protein
MSYISGTISKVALNIGGKLNVIPVPAKSFSSGYNTAGTSPALGFLM